MAVTNYQSETGEALWKAYVCVRSRLNPAIRIQRTKFGCKTQKQAEREETRLLRECQTEMLHKETQGSTWGTLVEAWGKHLEVNEGDRIGNDSRDDYLASLNKHTLHWWNRSAAGITRGDVDEVLGQIRANGGSCNFLGKTKQNLQRVFAYGMERNLIKGMDRAPT